MNRFHITVWNAARRQYIVASELSRRRTRGTSAARAVAGAFVGGLLALPAMAASTCNTGAPGESAPVGGVCALPDYHPPASNAGVGGVVVTDGDTVTLRGASSISTGYNGNTTVPATAVQTVSGTFDSSSVATGPQSIAVAVTDPVTGIATVFRTFDSSAFLDHRNNETPVNQYEDVQGDLYHGVSLGSVGPGGGTLNVDVGAAPGGAPSANRLMLTAKQSHLVSADGTGAANSQIVWTSRNAIDLGIDPGLPTPDDRGVVTVEVPVTTYAGTVSFGGVNYAVGNAAQLAAYNDALVAALRSGQLASQREYDEAFARAFSTVDVPVGYQTGTTAGDLVRLPNGDRYAILARGARGSALVAEGAQIDVTRASGAVRATDGATVTNRGVLSGNVIEQVVKVESGGRFVNGATGVVSSGYLAGDRADTATDPMFYYTGSGVIATGAGTTVQNDGVVNVAGFAYPRNTSVGMGLADGAQGRNAGIVNAGVNPGYVTTVVGVNVSGGSSFTNDASGVIHIGRSAQYGLGDAAVDVATAGPTYGVRIMDTGDSAVNAGRIVIGSQTQNAVAMYSTAPLGSLLLNTGTIDIDGAAAGVPLANIGMFADDNGSAAGGAVARNAGTINIDGVNGIGILVNANPGAQANAESTGAINVGGSADPAGGTRNIGVWVDGPGAAAKVAGALNLNGRGAIGAFAQDGGSIAVAASAVPRFAGEDQIGFYVSGAGSTIQVDANALTVDTARSTLFRVADGATYDGTSAGGPLAITVSGQGARGVVATGMGTVLSTGASTYELRGGADGAAAIVVEGGASATISAATDIRLLAAGTTAAIVDGQGYDLTGAARGGPIASSIVNQASIRSASASTTGVVARNLGTFVNDGGVSMEGASSVGVRLEAGGALRNRSAVRAADGTGVLVTGAQTQVINEGSIRADGGVAALHVSGPGASVAISGPGTIEAGGAADGIRIGPAASGVSSVVLAGGAVAVQGGSALRVMGSTADIVVRDGASLSAASGTLLSVADSGTARFVADRVALRGNLLSDAGSSAEARLRNGSWLTGRVDGVAMAIDAGSTWRVSANSFAPSIANAGAVVFEPPADGYKTLSTGAFSGTGGTLVLNTYLDSDGAASDRLVVDAGTATGETGLHIVSAGGPGARTRGDGIRVVETINGASTATGAFRLAAPAQAGAYEYLLYRGGSAASDDYFLRSMLEDPDGSSPSDPAYRPAVVGYTLTPALNLDYGFSSLGRLHERVGDVARLDRAQPGSRDGLWGRMRAWGLDADAGSRFSARQKAGFMQVGKDWTLEQGKAGSTHAGVMASLGWADMRFEDGRRARVPGLSVDTGKTVMQASSVGGYFTKYSAEGAYWDSVVQATYYRNRYDDRYGVRGVQHGAGVAVSQEVGKPFALSGGVSVEPQAQLIYQYLKLDGFDDGVSGVSGNGRSAVRGRLGVRVFASSEGDAAKPAPGTPYATLDVLRDFSSPGRVSVAGTSVDARFGRTWMEAGAGISTAVGKSGQFYAEAKLAWGLDGEKRRGVVGQAGYRHSW